MKSLLEVLNLSHEYLKQKGIQNPRRQAEELISDIFGIKRLDLYLQFEKPLTDAELKTCRERLSRRGKGEPLQYIRGEVEFYGCRIHISPDVLIPRQETEILTDKIAKTLANSGDLDGKELWDICCGSGCIGIALKKTFPSLHVVLADISSGALEIAKKNALENGVEIEIQQGDLLQPFHGRKANFLVCNPPYVSENEYQILEPEVRLYEPRLALVANKEGMEFYERLSRDLKEFLHPSSKVWLEIGASQGKEIKHLFGQGWKRADLEQDWSSKDRFFFLETE